MSDLISRKALMDIFQEKANENNGLLRNNMLFAKDMVEHEPAAYDVDKVIEQLEDAYGSIYVKDDVDLGTKRGLSTAITIVKGAGADE